MSSWGRGGKVKTKPNKKPQQTNSRKPPKKLSVAIFGKIQHYPSNPPAQLNEPSPAHGHLLTPMTQVTHTLKQPQGNTLDRKHTKQKQQQHVKHFFSPSGGNGKLISQER